MPLILLLLVIASTLYARSNNFTLIDEYDALEPGFRPLTPDEFKARVPSVPVQPSASNDKGPLPKLPDFGISFQASDADSKQRDRELREKETINRKQQDELKKMHEDLKRRQEDLKRQQDDFQKKANEERKKRDAQRRREEKEQLERERKREEEKTKRQLKPSESANNNLPVPRVEPRRQTPSANINKKVDDKKDNKKDDGRKKDEKKKPQPVNKRAQLPKKYEVPRNAGIRGKLGGNIPDQGIVISPEDRYVGSSSAYNLSPSIFQFLLLFLLVMV
jgi:hypothetical protein